MDKLIPINYDNDIQTVNGRDLHEFLEVDSNYTTWFKRMTEYGFSQGTDFIPFLEESTGGRPSENHKITIEMAKEISMLQRTEKGKQARQYFIQIEKAWNSPEAIMSRALRLADRKILQLETSIQKLQPKAQEFDKFISGENYQDMNTVAKALGWGRNKLFAELRARNILMRGNKPYQRYIDAGYFVVKEKPIEMGEQVINKIQTYVTPRGVEYISKMLNAAS